MTQKIKNTHLDHDMAAYRVSAPDFQKFPFVLSSPHSGRYYPNFFLEQTDLSPLELRRSEDAYVDTFIEFAPSTLAVPYIKALFPRAYVDANREPYELDPKMFCDNLPAFVNSTSPRVIAGLGTIPKIVGPGKDIYAEKLHFHDALHRIETLYTPYHTTLKRLITATKKKFGICYMLDCHSMPSQSVAGLAPIPDIVLGTGFGHACRPAFLELTERTFVDAGFSVAVNTPFAGGYTTHHYGAPDAHVECIQIEIRRDLYMDEKTIKPNHHYTQFKNLFAHTLKALITHSKYI